MNKYAELMRDVAENLSGYEGWEDLGGDARKLIQGAEELERQEPVAHMVISASGYPEKCLPSSPGGFPVYAAPLYTHPPADAGKAIPEGWREKFKREVYHNLSAADNQDIPLEEYPDRILSVLDSLLAAPKPSEQQPVAEVKYGGYASGNELVWAKGAGLQFLPEGTKLYAASIHAPTPVAYLDVGAGGYMDLGTDLTEDQVGSLPWGRHILAIVGTYGADGYVPAEQQSFKSDIAETEKERRLERDIASTIEKMMGLNAQNRALAEALEYLMGKYPASRHLQDTCTAALAAYRKGAQP